MIKSHIKIALLIALSYSLSTEVFAQETIFSKEQNNTKQELTNEQKLLNKFIKNSRRKFNPRGNVSVGNTLKNRIIASEIHNRKQQQTKIIQTSVPDLDTTECHHHPKHVLKINTFGVYSGDYVNVNYNNSNTAYYLGLGAAQFTFKTEDNGLWKNGALSLFVANTHGDNPSAQNTGDLEVFDNIEAPSEQS